MRLPELLSGLIALLIALLTAGAAWAASPVAVVRSDAESGTHRLVLDPALGASWQEVNIGRLVVRTPLGQRAIGLEGSAAPPSKSRELDLDLPSVGCALIIANLGPGFDKGRPDAWRRITHAAKIVACSTQGAVDEDSKAALESRRRAGGLLMAKTGGRAEIRPLANPATLRPGAELPVRAYCRGQAGAGIEVVATAPDGSRRYARTDAVGSVSIAIESAGPWHLAISCSDADAPDDLPLTASLDVEVLTRASWAALLGDRR